jgi:RNA polymerase sigma-70 factor (ECF subfamily)
MSMLLQMSLSDTAAPPATSRAGAEEWVKKEVVGMDEASFHSFYARTANRLRAYLMNATGDPNLTDDLIQESYFRMIRSGFTTDDEDYRKNYLFRIATNLLRDHHRRQRPQVEVLPETASSPSPGDQANLRSDVGRVLKQLKPKDREMLWLAYVEGSSHREIADMLGLKAASIRSMLFRARQRLAGLLRATGLAPGKSKEAAT